MKCDNYAMRLYAVTDRSWLNGRSLVEDVKASLEGGVTMIQLREKDLSEDEFMKEAKEIKELCKAYKVPFLINDNVELALQVDADGVHVGQDDMAVEEVRRILGEDKIIGVSTRTVEQAKKAYEGGADYLGVGAVFSTSTKLDAKAVEHQVVNDICEAVPIPVCAIGGINKSNLLELKGNHLDGVALVSAIYAAEDITKECRELLEMSNEMVGE